MDSQVLAGKSALVTGASQGIGMACARALARDGATVVIMGRRADALANARSELAAQVPGARIELFAGDACNEDAMKAAVDFTHGLADRLDILVTAVGGPSFTPVLQENAANVRQSFELNFMSTFLAVQHSLPKMQRGGAIVCISTAGVTQAYKGLSIYSATKAALERFVRAAAYEVGGAGIRINAVRPGFTLSKDAIEKLGMSAMVENYAAEIPLGRIGEPDDIARVVRFLAGPESGWVTGQAFSADGGQDQSKSPELLD